MSDIRELSADELKQIEIAKQKIYPTLTSSYNTKLLDLMASPFKKSIMALVLFLIVYLVVYIGLRFYKMNSIKVMIFVNIFFGLISIYIVFSNYFSQNRINEDYTLIIRMTNINATLYDYESSPVIKEKLMRNTLSRGRRSDGYYSTTILGGVGGYQLGKNSASKSKPKSKSRRSMSFGRRRR